MQQIPGLPPAAFSKADRAPDRVFYRQPRFVTHIDDAAIGTVTRIYRETLVAGGTLLDLMSSWVSHLPAEVAYGPVTGHGMNAEELAANPRLARWFVQDLNAEPGLPLETGGFDGVTLCVSVQYLQRPVEVFREVVRVLRAGAPFIVTFSNRCFPTKAVAIWQGLPGAEQQRLVSAYMQEAGLDGITAAASVPRGTDPLWSVVGYARRAP